LDSKWRPITSRDSRSSAARRDADDARRIDSYSAPRRHYLGTWQAVNIALHGEDTHRAGGDASGLKDNLSIVLLDLDF
jgi:hypothetical protein